MNRFGRAAARGWLACGLGLPVGCAALFLHADPAPQAAAPAEPAPPAQPPAGSQPVKLCSATEPAANQDMPFQGAAELSVTELVQQVLARNPSLAQMTAAWQAAAARYPQVTSLDDPMTELTIGPRTIAPDDPDIHFAYRVMVSQKYPWPGKLALRGENALAEASAAGHDVESMHLQLAESTRSAFSDYYLAERALEVNADSLRLLREFERVARSRVASGQATEQDLLQARVEVGREEVRRLPLDEARRIVVARLNTLLHLPPDHPLPPPPKELPRAEELRDVAALRSAALARRPDLRALADHLAAEQAALALAEKEFYPDLEPFVMYDRFMGNNAMNDDLATMLGLRLNLPVCKARRHAAVTEAQARIAQRQAELARQTDQVNLEVQEAYERVRTAVQTVRLYHDTLLPAAELNRKAAVSAYETGKIAALGRIEAERDLVMLRDRYYEAVAEHFRRRAALERVSGGPSE
jgi:outer membrane protein TolC